MPSLTNRQLAVASDTLSAPVTFVFAISVFAILEFTLLKGFSETGTRKAGASTKRLFESRNYLDIVRQVRIGGRLHNLIRTNEGQNDFGEVAYDPWIDG